MHLKDKTLWITGASSGIGEALAKAASARGAKVALSARNGTELERVAEACQALGGKTLALPLDVAQPATFPAAAAAVTAALGNIDILVNNAGIGQRANAMDTRPEVVRRIFEVNFFGAIELTRAVLPGMVARRQGRIVVVSSVLGKIELPGRSAYVASKHALQGYFDTLRAELAGSGVGVTVVCPGWIETNISKNALEGDGSPHQGKIRVSRRRMNADACARQIWRAVERERDEATMGGAEILGTLVKRLSPSFFRRAIRRFQLPRDGGGDT
jgi:short-subunit dehydrogenase